MEIFHGRLQEEKQRLGLASTSGHAGPTTYISINRQRILEDGFQQMRQLSALCLKGTIRVKFVNLQVSVFIVTFSLVLVVTTDSM